MAKNSIRSLLIKFAKIAFVLLAIGLALYQLAIHWSAVSDFHWRFDPVWLALSIAGHLATFWLFSLVWCQLIAGFGYTVPVKYGFKIGYITNLGRYLPGRIWPVFGMAYFAKRLGIREQDSVTSWVIALVFALTASFIAAGIGLLLTPELMKAGLQKQIGAGVLVAAVLLLLASIALVLLPGPTLSALNLVLRAFRRSEVNFSISVRVAVKVTAGYFVCWVVYGISFWMFLKSIVGGVSLPMVPMITTFIIAYQLGYLALFTPGGVGVRELVIIGLLSIYVGPVAAGMAIAARLWNLVVEIFAFTIAWRIPFSAPPDCANPEVGSHGTNRVTEDDV